MQLDKPVRPDGDYYRQVVPSPRPLRLIDQQLTAVKLLMKNDCIVICAGGGGEYYLSVFGSWLSIGAQTVLIETLY